ncbi:MAG: NUDIX hydrolase [Muribaculaceae bacterium]|nr:NUDIX hydrolase [Muribaculaceae bacterium]
MSIEGKDIFTYRYPRPAVTTDCVIFGFDGAGLQVLLVRRGNEPFKGRWALPGGFIHMDETLEQCARRELEEETHVDHVPLIELGAYSKVDRDPRERVVTVAYIALVRPSDFRVMGGDDADEAAWFPVDDVPLLAFDHDEILHDARERLKEILRLRPVAFELVDKQFTVDDLRRVYEAVNNITYDRRNFHRKLMNSGLVEEVDPPEELFDMEIMEECLPTMSCCCAEPPAITEMEKEITETDRRSSRQSKGRPARWFSLRRPSDTDPDTESTDDASVKDIFNF